MSEESAEIISHSSASSAELVAPPSDFDKIECCESVSQGIGSSQVHDSDQLEGSVEASHAALMPTSYFSGTILPHKS